MNTTDFHWTTKPPLGSQLDRGHPLAAGLASYLLLNEGGGGPRDLANPGGGWTVTGAPPWVSGRPGPGLKLDGSTQYLTAVGAVPRVTAGDFSVSLLMAPASVSTSQWMWSQGTLAAGSFMGLGVNSTGVPRWETAGTSVIGSTALTASTLYRFTLTWMSGRTNHLQCFLTPGLTGKTVTDLSATTGATYTVDNVRVGADPKTAPSTFGAATVYDFLLWKRCLSLAEVTWLGEEPWALVQDPAHRRWFVPAAAGNTPSAADAAALAEGAPAVALAGADAGTLGESPALGLGADDAGALAEAVAVAVAAADGGALAESAGLTAGPGAAEAIHLADAGSVAGALSGSDAAAAAETSALAAAAGAADAAAFAESAPALALARADAATLAESAAAGLAAVSAAALAESPALALAGADPAALADAGALAAVASTADALALAESAALAAAVSAVDAAAGSESGGVTQSGGTTPSATDAFLFVEAVAVVSAAVAAADPVALLEGAPARALARADAAALVEGVGAVGLVRADPAALGESAVLAAAVTALDAAAGTESGAVVPGGGTAPAAADAFFLSEAAALSAAPFATDRAALVESGSVQTGAAGPVRVFALAWSAANAPGGAWAAGTTPGVGWSAVPAPALGWSTATTPAPGWSAATAPTLPWSP